MLTRRLGSLEPSLAGLGCGNFGLFLDEAQSRRVVDAAIAEGITHFDTADVYGEGLSEQFLGQALGANRKDVVITTKFGSSQPADGSAPGSTSAIVRSCEASLARLGSDWIDLYLLHRPDPLTPIGETLEALGKLQQAGKIREIGCSNFGNDQLEEAAQEAQILGMRGFCAVQNSYSLLDRTAEAGIMSAARRLGVTLIPYLPLASGMLTGKYRSASDVRRGRLGKEVMGFRVADYFPALLLPEAFAILDRLERFAIKHGRTLTDLSLSWLASKPDVGAVITGASNAHQVKANLASTNSWQLSLDEQLEVESITRDDVAFTWNAGFPSYAKPPAEASRSRTPDIRNRNGHANGEI